ncbi:MAG: hypothetical protein J7484_10655 [Microbacterium sp.]|nr:hypothetical protein [Microbacterium sp.]
MSLTSPNRGYPLERIEGNDGSMATWVGTFDLIAEALGDLRDTAQRVMDLPGVGDAITRVRGDAQAIASPLRETISEAELLASVLSTYADAFSASAVPANRLIEDIEGAHASWVSAQHEAEQAGLAALWSSRSGPEADADAANEDAREAMSAADGAQQVVDELWHTWEALYSSWDEAYDRAMSSLVSGVATVLTNDERFLLDQLLAADGPAAVLKLWNDNPALRGALAEQYPDIIGNLDGIPFDVRAEVNFRRLTELYSRLETLAEPLKSDVAALWDEVDPSRGGKLISFDLNGSEQTTAAIWYGPFDASNVSTLVPGMLSKVDKIGEFGKSARDLIDNTDDAAIAWFGYDSPEVPEEPSMIRAQNGAPALRSFLLSLDAQAGDRTINVIAHSYGSTTAALAIGSSPEGLGVDRFITVGSAGLPDDEAILDNLQSPEAPRIYATLSDNDFWAPIGKLTGWGHHTDPSGLDGVTTFESDGGVDADGRPLLPTPGHSAHTGVNFPGQSAPGGYLLAGSESFYNVRQIVLVGEPGTESGGEGSAKGYWERVAEGLSSSGGYGFGY